MKLKRTGIATKLVVLVLLVAAVTALLSMRAKLESAQAERDQLAQQVLAQTERNAALADEIAHSQDPDYLEDIARSELGLMGPDEIVFIDTSN